MDRHLVWGMIIEHARGWETPLYDFLVEFPEHLADVQVVYQNLERRLGSRLLQIRERCPEKEAEDRMYRRLVRLSRTMTRLRTLYGQVEVALGIPQDDDIPF